MKNLNGADVNAGVENITGGGTCLTGAGIDFYRLLMIRTALELQASGGLRLSNKIPLGTTLARRLLGFKGNKESLLNQVNELINRIQSDTDW